MTSATVATLKHGDRLEILARRRAFLHVRTPGGAEGWTDERQLLAASDMQALQDLSHRAAKMPSQGQAFSFHEMTIHTLPVAHSPSFLTVAANEKVDVLTHMRTERKDVPRAPLIPAAPKKAKSARQGSGKQPKYPPPPMPKPPGPPPNWLDLSKTDLDEEAPPEETPENKVVPTDDWSLVRTSSGVSGWVLTRRLIMAIPDEVAQYAEGKRILSYLPLGSVMDGDQKKTVWLWTTTENGPQPQDFQSFRVFIWSLKRHRYETAFIARKVRGFSPVLLQEVEYDSQTRTRGSAATAKYPGFSVCLENDDGQRVRKQFALLGNIVRYAGEQPCEAPPPPLVTLDAPPPGSAPVAAPAVAPPVPTESFAERVRKRLRAMKKGLFGG